jgi:hypothetical protein
MWKKVVIASGIGALNIGSGGAALAASTSSTSPSPATSSTSTPSAGKAASTSGPVKHHRRRDPLLRAEHAQWVTHDKKTNTNVTHDEIRGTVTAVSPTSISVKATDGTTETYSVASTSKVHAKGDTKTSPGTISQVKVGDRAIVVGTGSSTYAATRIIDHGAPKAPTSTTTPTS